jgi:hypothetical protein
LKANSVLHTDMGIAGKVCEFRNAAARSTRAAHGTHHSRTRARAAARLLSSPRRPKGASLQGLRVFVAIPRYAVGDWYFLYLISMS